MRLIKHIVLIVLIVLILLPMFWIAATSIRRDNAAFSTKLLSTRYTFQYYKDLLFNRKNIPQQITELKKITNLSTEYSGMSKEELLDNLNRTERELKRQMTLSKEQIAKSEGYVDEVVQYAKSKTDEIYQRFSRLKNEERDFLQGELDQILTRSDLLSVALNLELIESLEEVPKEEKEAYLKIIQEQAPEFVEAYNGIIGSMDNYKDFIQSEYETWHRQIQTDLNDDIEKELEEIHQRFLNLLTPHAFSYSKWNREINLRGYRGISNDLEPVLTQEGFEKWNQLTELFKATAQEIDEAVSEYETKKTEITTPLSQRLNQDNSAVAEYLETESERKAVYDTVLRLENSIQTTQQEMMDIEERLKILDQKLQATVYELKELKELFALELKKDTTNKVSSAPSVETIMVQLESLSQMIQGMGEIKVAEKNMLEMKTTIDWFVSNRQEIINISEKPLIENGMGVLRNNINPISTDLEDFSSIMERYSELQKQLDSEELQLQTEREVLEVKRKLLEELEQVYEKALSRERNIERSKSIISLLNLLEGIEDYEGLTEYHTKISDYISEYGLINNPLKELLSQLSSLNKLVYLDRNYFKETKYLKETVDKIESILADFDVKKETYMNLIHANVMIKVTELDEIEKLQKDAYNRFSSELNRIARIASDLSELEAYSQIVKPLENIDKNIFESLQYWVKKPEQQFMRWLVNTVILAVATAGITVMFCALGAYPFSRLRFKGRKYGLLFLLLIQMFPIVMGMVALYLLLRFIGQFLPGFGLDSLWGLGLIYLGNIAFNMWLLKGYFDTIPDSLEEAAMIDGSTRFQTFWRIILPLTAPMLAVVFLIVFMANFNEFVLASVVLQSPENYTFAVGLQSFSYGPYQMEWGLFTAAALIGALPMVILSLSLQRYLVSGLTSGAVKG